MTSQLAEHECLRLPGGIGCSGGGYPRQSAQHSLVPWCSEPIDPSRLMWSAYSVTSLTR